VIDETMQEQAAAYALGALDEEQTGAFELSLRADQELRALVRELRSVTEALAGTAPALEPPAAAKLRLLAEIDQQLRAKAPKPAAPESPSSAPASTAGAGRSARLSASRSGALPACTVVCRFAMYGFLGAGSGAGPRVAGVPVAGRRTALAAYRAGEPHQ